MKVGDLVIFRPRNSEHGTAGYADFPGEYKFHKIVRIMDGVGIITEKRDTFCRVYVYDNLLWFGDYQLRVLRSRDE